jgi:hypothetical protein
MNYEALELISSVEPSCCENWWVLVIHDDFSRVQDLQRIGDDVDVTNLRQAFAVDRQCRFAELANCHSKVILNNLSNWRLFADLFGQADENGNYKIKFMRFKKINLNLCTAICYAITICVKKLNLIYIWQIKI